MESPTHKLLGHLPEIQEIVTVPKGYLKKPSAILQLRRQLRAWKPDVVLDPQSLTKSAFLGWLSGAPVRIGLAGSHQKELSGWLNNVHVPMAAGTTHLLDRTLQLLPAITKYHPPAVASTSDLAGLGQPANSGAIAANQYPHTRQTSRQTFRWRLPVPEADSQWAQDYLVSQGLSAPAVINPGASWASKRWVPQRFAQVAKRLKEQRGRDSLVTWAGAEEKAWAEEIAHGSRGAARVAPDTTLLQLCALCQQASLFVGCDTGPMHMAAAVGTPCVVLFGPTRPEDSGPYGQLHYGLQAWYQSGGARERRRAENEAMRDISIEQVVGACQSVLDATQQRREAG